MDDALKTLRPNLPNADELLMCDEGTSLKLMHTYDVIICHVATHLNAAFIKTHGPNVKAIVWLCLVYMAVDVDPPGR